MSKTGTATYQSFPPIRARRFRIFLNQRRTSNPEYFQIFEYFQIAGLRDSNSGTVNSCLVCAMCSCCLLYL